MCHKVVCSDFYKSNPQVPTERSALEDDEEGDQELTTEQPKRAEEEAEERKEDEEDEEEEVGDEDKATVDVVKPLAEPEAAESRAEAAGQSCSRKFSSIITCFSFT